jgi:hypothetical protein
MLAMTGDGPVWPGSAGSRATIGIRQSPRSIPFACMGHGLEWWNLVPLMQRALWPDPEELAVAFYESFAFKLRERLSNFVHLTLPHAPYGTPVRMSEAINLACVTGEVEVQCEPIRRSGFPHGQTPCSHSDPFQR